MYRLTIVSILIIFNLEYEAILKTSTLDYVIGAYLTQKRNNNRMRIVAFYTCKITGPELNYDFHDKELLVIVEALRE